MAGVAKPLPGGKKISRQDILECPLNYIKNLNLFKSIDNSSTYWIEKYTIMGAGIRFVMV